MNAWDDIRDAALLFYDFAIVAVPFCTVVAFGIGALTIPLPKSKYSILLACVIPPSVALTLAYWIAHSPCPVWKL